MDSKSQQDIEFFGVCSWQIWSARNEFYFDKIAVSLDLCYKRGHDMLVEYRKANALSEAHKSRRDKAKWVPPPLDCIKINVDAALNNREDRVGLGFVARDSSGKVLLAASKSSWPALDAERAEIDAFLWAARKVKEQQWNNVIIEGDVQSVVKALQGYITRNFYNQVMISNTLEELANVNNLSFNFCFREANEVAHRLARWVAASVCSSVWFDDGPLWIQDVVISDLSP